MQNRADIRYQDNKFFVLGNLNFVNVMSVFNASLAEIKKQTELHFDFSQLQSSNSAGLALIIEWIKFAKQHNKKIQFSHISTDLLSIAKAASLDQLIEV